MDTEGIAIRSLQSVALGQPPSCVEFLPSHQDFFVVGTYHLHKNLKKGEDLSANDSQATSNAQSRSGSLVLLNLEKSNLYACISWCSIIEPSTAAPLLKAAFLKQYRIPSDP